MHTNFRWNITLQCRQVARKCMTSDSSSSSHQNPFPYPLHRNPSPYQIFHLPSTATEGDIKARYFQLVRLYHPDKVGTSTSSDIAHTRFQAITAAYDVLRGKTLDNTSGVSGSANFPYKSTASWRAMHRRRQELYDSGPVDDGKNDKLIIVGVVATIVIALFQIATFRREALEDIVSRTRRRLSEAEQHRQQATMDKGLSLNKKQVPDETRSV